KPPRVYTQDGSARVTHQSGDMKHGPIATNADNGVRCRYNLLLCLEDERCIQSVRFNQLAQDKRLVSLVGTPTQKGREGIANSILLRVCNNSESHVRMDSIDSLHS